MSEWVRVRKQTRHIRGKRRASEAVCVVRTCSI
eukprot:COSAG01_NODE_16285_length_1250_cov_24.827107_3_plen_32_part_01